MLKSGQKKYSFLLAFVLLLAACSPATPLNGQVTPSSADSIRPKPSMALQPCMLGSSQAQCGTMKVYENRASNSGRMIELHVAVIKAQSDHPAPDPIFYLAGGPGGSAIEAASYALRVLKSANQLRDVVFVDQRGTGSSNQLTCPRSVEEANSMIPPDDTMLQDLSDCLSRLDGDPAAYTTAWGMDDLDDVRAALGYDQINLYGESYGPTAGQVYQQRHGEHVRTMTLEGTTLLDLPMFERLPRSSQEALDLLLTRCQADTACQAAYPNLEAELAALIAQIEKQPVSLPLNNPHTGLPISFNHDMLIQGLHSLMYGTQNAVMLPYMVHQMYQGKFDEIAQALAPNFNAASPSSVWNIMNLTILCNEDWAKMRPAETAQFSQGSYMGYEDVRRFAVPEQVCARMPQPQPEALYQPVTVSPVPVLIITNQADPGNPQENVADAKAHYPNSLNGVAPGQGHGYTGIDCRDGFISAFIESGSVERLDTSCLKDVQLPAFVVP